MFCSWFLFFKEVDWGPNRYYLRVEMFYQISSINQKKKINF